MNTLLVVVLLVLFFILAGATLYAALRQKPPVPDLLSRLETPLLICAAVTWHAMVLVGNNSDKYWTLPLTLAFFLFAAHKDWI